jgi:hypothetical protein
VVAESTPNEWRQYGCETWQHKMIEIETDCKSKNIRGMYSFIHQWLYSPLLGPGLFFSFVIFSYAVRGTPWTSDQPVARPLPTHKAMQTQNKRTQTSMPRVGFEPMIPVFERVKIVHALVRAATVKGRGVYNGIK